MVTRSPLPSSGVHKVCPHPGTLPRQEWEVPRCLHTLRLVHIDPAIRMPEDHGVRLLENIVRTTNLDNLDVTEISKVQLESSSSAHFCNHSDYMCLCFLI